MIFILNKDFKIILTLRIDETNKSNTRYFDDIYNGNLETGTATFNFSTLLNNKTGEAIVGGNYIAYKDDSNKFKVFQIMIVKQISNSIPSLNVYCESAGMDLLYEPFRARKINPCNIHQFLTVALSETDWELGYIDDSLIDIVTISGIDKDINRLKLIQQEISKFNCDIEFITELKNGCLKKYVNAYKRKGKLYKTRLEVQRNTDEIVRTVDFTNVATALIGQGNDGLKFTDIEIEDIEKPIGQDFVYDIEAFERYNVNGRHLFRIYEYDTDSPYELLRKTNEALNTYSKPNIKYEIKADLFSSLSNEDFYSLEEGDTFYITDYNFEPPLFLEARVSDITKSKTNTSNNKVVFSNFRELKSNITEDSLKKLSNKISQIKAQQDEDSKKIDLKADKTDVSQAIENIEIGTVNYALKTSESKTFVLNNTSNQNITCYKVLDDTSNKEVIISFDYEFKDLVINPNGNIYFQAISFKEDWTNKWYVPKVECFKDLLKEGNSSGSISFKTTFPEFKKGTYLDFRFRSDFLNGTFIVKNVQVEIGNKKTDWKPNPLDFSEDIDNKIAQSKEEIKLETDNIKLSVTNLDSEINLKFNGVNESINNNTLNIGILNNDLKLKAEPSDIDKAIQNIDIGTVNYALKTGEEKIFELNNTSNQNITCYQVLDDTSNKDVIVSFDYEFKDLIISENSDIYFQAISFKEDGTNKWYIPKVECFKDLLKEGNSSGSISFKTTFPEFKKGTTLTFRFRADYLQGTFTVKNVQVETGNKKTDWKPNTSDFSEDINNLKEKTTEIELTADKIHWLVKDGTDQANMELTKEGLNVIANAINLNGLVKFTDLSKENSNTIINGSNIKTGLIDAEFIDVDNLIIRGELISGQINGVDGVKFAYGAYITSYDYSVAKGISFSAPDFKFISSDVHFEYGINNINNNWYIDKDGNCKFNGSITGKNNIQLTNGSVYLPQGGGSQVTDYLRLGEVIMAGLNSFHFITKSGERATLFASNLNTTYSISEDSVSITDITNIFDIINSVDIIETENGLRITDKKLKESIYNNCINISINEKTKEKDISISVIDTLTILWKAIQELKEENNYIKNQIQGEK